MVSPLGDEPSQHKGDAGVDYVLHGGRKAQAEDVPIDFALLRSEERTVPENISPALFRENVADEDSRHDGLGGDSRDGCAGDAETREGTDAPDEDRVHDHIEDKACAVGHKRRPGVSLCIENAGQMEGHKEEDHKSADDADVADSVGDGRRIAQAEVSHQLLCEQKGDEAVEDSQEDSQLHGGSGVGSSLFPVFGPQFLAHQNLAAHAGQGDDAGGEPGVHAAHADRSHGVCSQGSHPGHIRQVIGGRQKGGGHDGHGEAHERRSYGLAYQIDILSGASG